MIKKKYIETFTINQLLLAKTHIGLKKQKWNPLIKSFLFGARHGVHFFDLKLTIPFLRRALSFVKSATQNHEKILFVGSHFMIIGLISFLAKHTLQHSITKKWVCGTLTNWKLIRPYIKFLYTTTIDNIRLKWILRTEKKVDQKIKQYLKMKNLFEGIENLSSLPNLVILLEREDAYAFNEATQLMIPVVLLVNTNHSGLRIPYPIFGNTHLFDNLFFYMNLIYEAIKEGFHKRRLILFKKAANLVVPSQNKNLPTDVSKDFDKYAVIKFNIFFRAFRNYKTLSMKRMVRKYAFTLKFKEKMKITKKTKKISKKSK
jgi:small subunit ribosomal protein S2